MKESFNVIEFQTSDISSIGSKDSTIINYFDRPVKWSSMASMYSSWAKLIDINLPVIVIKHISTHSVIIDWINGINTLWPDAKIHVRLEYSDIRINDSVLSKIISHPNINIEIRTNHNSLLIKELQCMYDDMDVSINAVDIVDNTAWKVSYDNIKDETWPDCDVPDKFTTLPIHIQEECIDVYGISGEDYITDNSVSVINSRNRIILMPKKQTKFNHYYNPLNSTINNLALYNSNKYEGHAGCKYAKQHQFVNGKLYKCWLTALPNKITNKLDSNKAKLINSYKPLTLSDTKNTRNVFFNKLHDIGSVLPQCSLCNASKGMPNKYNDAIVKYVQENITDTIVTKVHLFHQCTFIDDLDTRTKNVVILMHDFFHHTDDNGPNGYYNKNSVSKTIMLLHAHCKIHKDQTFVLVTENCFVDRELDRLPTIRNLTVISTPNFFFHDYDRNVATLRTYDKNFNTEKHVICLTSTPTAPRVITILYLIKQKLNSITMSFMSTERKNNIPIKTYYNNSYNLEPFLEYIDTKTKSELLQIHDNNFNNFPFLSEGNWKNSGTTYDNYRTHLHKLYQDTFIEIIPETTFLAPSANISEKFIHMVYGRNFPIFIGTLNMVQKCRDLGFDVFDDIIDHSYDLEKQPFQRIKKAIDLNLDLLTNKNKTIQLWKQNEQRFNNNIEVYKELFKTECATAISTINNSIK